MPGQQTASLLEQTLLDRLAGYGVTTMPDELMRLAEDVIAYQSGRFDPPQSHEQTTQRLAAGAFPIRTFRDVDLWDDLVLAHLAAGQAAPAVEALRDRLRPYYDAWQTKHGGDAARDIDGFISDLVSPRQQSGPRLGTYKGRAPLRSWLRQVHRSICSKERDRVGRTVSLGEHDRPSEGTATGHQLMREECIGHLKPLIGDALRELSERERLVVRGVLIAGESQSTLARALEVVDGTVTRIKQRALEKLRLFFEQFTGENSASPAIRDCVEHLLGASS